VRVPGTWLVEAVGGTLMIAGAALGVAAVYQQGAWLSVLPHPVAGGAVLERGAYRLVRHPMYAGLVLVALGWALIVRGGLTLGYALLLLLLLDTKARREERWLVLEHPGYAQYRRRVRRLVPFVY